MTEGATRAYPSCDVPSPRDASHRSSRGNTIPEYRLDERIASTELVPSEESVARFLADHRDEVLFMTAGEVAAAAKVGSATVVRTVKRLGYPGLPELKKELQADLVLRATPARRLIHSLEEIGDAEPILEHVLSFQISLLTEASRSIEEGTFERALELVSKAKRVVIFCSGGTISHGEYFSLALRRFGWQTLVVPGAEAADGIVDLSEHDILVVLAYQVVDRALTGALDLANERRTPTILVTDRLSLALKGRYTVALAARRGSILEYPTSVVTQAILEAIVIGLSARNRERVIAAMERLVDVHGRLGK